MKVIDFAGKNLIVHQLDLTGELMTLLGGKGFITMLPANSEDDIRRAFNAAKILSEHGCVEFCCLGKYAHQIEDMIDFWLEIMGMVNVATTAFVERFEAFEYFLFAAGGGDKTLIALSDDSAIIADELLRFAKGYC